MEVFCARLLADLPELARLDRLTFGANAYAPGVSRQLLQVSRLTLLGQDGGGVAHASALAQLAAGSPTGWSGPPGVEPLHRRAGYGRVIVERAAADGRPPRAGRVRLTCAPDARESLTSTPSSGSARSSASRTTSFLARHRLRLSDGWSRARTARSGSRQRRALRPGRTSRLEPPCVVEGWAAAAVFE